MVVVSSETLHLLLTEKRSKKVQQLYYRIDLDDIHHE